MADKAISELTAAEQIKSTDLFVLEQDGAAKRLQGQVLLNWLTAAADGHGGIADIKKTGSSELVDIYTITLADTTTKTFTVTNGNGLTNFEKVSTVGLVDNYRFTRTDGTFFDFSVYNGAKGDKGEDSHVWIKYASQQPTADSHSMGDLPDAWMGVYSGTAEEAPDDWQQYMWYQIKGEKGDTGAAATVTGTTVEYMVSDSGTIVPSGSWSTVIPTVPQGKYLWTKVTTTFNTGSPAVSYSVTRMGIDGAGSVSSVNEKSPDESGNVSLSAEDISTSGGRSVQAVLDDKQEALTAGENISISGSVIATKAFPCNPNLLDNWYFGNPVNQRNGKIVPAGIMLYADSALTQERGPNGDTEAVDLTYTSPTSVGWVSMIDGLTYYAAASDVVPGYKGGLYGIDRFTFDGQGGIVIVGDGFVSFQKTGEYTSPIQFFEPNRVPANQTVTISAIVNDDLFFATGTLESNVQVSCPGGRVEAYRLDNRSVFRFVFTGSGVYKVKAIKLELGTQQTIAHQENGVWVLNEIPKFGDQLAECQRYAIRLSKWARIRAAGIEQNLIDFSVPIPTSMRAVPGLVDASKFIVRTFSGTTQDGFSLTTLGGNENAVFVRATKTAHGLSDAQLYIDDGAMFSADL